MSALIKSVVSFVLLMSTFDLYANDIRANQVSELPITLQVLLEQGGRDNAIGLMQLGYSNHAEMLQSGHDNTNATLQFGAENQANVHQYGSGNEVQLLQVGWSNQADITQVGDGNLVQLNQLGSANFSIEQIADNAAITITQY